MREMRQTNVGTEMSSQDYTDWHDLCGRIKYRTERHTLWMIWFNMLDK